jgi:hypothetical protein
MHGGAPFHWLGLYLEYIHTYIHIYITITVEFMADISIVFINQLMHRTGQHLVWKSYVLTHPQPSTSFPVAGLGKLAPWPSPLKG